MSKTNKPDSAVTGKLVPPGTGKPSGGKHPLEGLVFTTTEQRILTRLQEGGTHPPGSLISCLYDELGSLDAVRVHINNMNKKLRPVGQEIVCISLGTHRGYKIVGIVSSVNGNGQP
jgi:hypothetical protein